MRELQIIETECVSGAGIVQNTYDKVVAFLDATTTKIIQTPFNVIAYIPRLIAKAFTSIETKITSTIIGLGNSLMNNTIGKIVGTVDKFLPF